MLARRRLWTGNRPSRALAVTAHIAMTYKSGAAKVSIKGPAWRFQVLNDDRPFQTSLTSAAFAAAAPKAVTIAHSRAQPFCPAGPRGAITSTAGRAFQITRPT